MCEVSFLNFNISSQAQAVVMIGTYDACAKFIRLAKEKNFSPLFYNVSFVGSAELARRLGMGGPPALGALVQALQVAGYRASASGVMPGQVRTDAELPQLLQICTSLQGEGI